jgi:hypothetical protein
MIVPHEGIETHLSFFLDVSRWLCIDVAVLQISFFYSER